ncbi:hypothetical protein D0T57_15500 [Dysgonomonas sp. 511]|nr:hypothetical protein [Dysgonomonas sp. 511]
MKGTNKWKTYSATGNSRYAGFIFCVVTAPQGKVCRAAFAIASKVNAKVKILHVYKMRMLSAPRFNKGIVFISCSDCWAARRNVS